MATRTWCSAVVPRTKSSRWSRRSCPRTRPACELEEALGHGHVAASGRRSSDLLEDRARSPHMLQCILDLLGDDKDDLPSLGTKHLGVAHLGLVNAHVPNIPILANPVGFSILMGPEQDPGGLFVNASDEARCHEDEVLL